jgi:hypothetical protein
MLKGDRGHFEEFGFGNTTRRVQHELSHAIIFLQNFWMRALPLMVMQVLFLVYFYIILQFFKGFHRLKLLLCCLVEKFF